MRKTLSMIAGAAAVAVGTANFTDPHTAIEVIAGISDYLARHNHGHVSEIVGSVQT